MAAAFAVAYLTGDGWRNIHVSAGYVATAMMAARVAWGFMGPCHARFAHFVKPPAVIYAYLVDMLYRRETRFVGHNPAGGAMIVTLLIVVLMTGASGILLETEWFWGSEALDVLHGGLAGITALFVVMHVVGVVVTSVRTRENLGWAMLTGFKRSEGDHS